MGVYSLAATLIGCATSPLRTSSDALDTLRGTFYQSTSSNKNLDGGASEGAGQVPIRSKNLEPIANYRSTFSEEFSKAAAEQSADLIASPVVSIPGAFPASDPATTNNTPSSSDAVPDPAIYQPVSDLNVYINVGKAIDEAVAKNNKVWQAKEQERQLAEQQRASDCEAEVKKAVVDALANNDLLWQQNQAEALAASQEQERQAEQIVEKDVQYAVNKAVDQAIKDNNKSLELEQQSMQQAQAKLEAELKLARANCTNIEEAAKVAAAVQERLWADKLSEVRTQSEDEKTSLRTEACQYINKLRRQCSALREEKHKAEAAAQEAADGLESRAAAAEYAAHIQFVDHVRYGLACHVEEVNQAAYQAMVELTGLRNLAIELYQYVHILELWAEWNHTDLPLPSTCNWRNEISQRAFRLLGVDHLGTLSSYTDWWNTVDIAGSLVEKLTNLRVLDGSGFRILTPDRRPTINIEVLGDRLLSLRNAIQDSTQGLDAQEAEQIIYNHLNMQNERHEKFDDSSNEVCVGSSEDTATPSDPEHGAGRIVSQSDDDSSPPRSYQSEDAPPGPTAEPELPITNQQGSPFMQRVQREMDTAFAASDEEDDEIDDEVLNLPPKDFNIVEPAVDEESVKDESMVGAGENFHTTIKIVDEAEGTAIPSNEFDPLEILATTSDTVGAGDTYAGVISDLTAEVHVARGELDAIEDIVATTGAVKGKNAAIGHYNTAELEDVFESGPTTKENVANDLASENLVHPEAVTEANEAAELATISCDKKIALVQRSDELTLCEGAKPSTTGIAAANEPTAAPEDLRDIANFIASPAEDHPKDSKPAKENTAISRGLPSIAKGCRSAEGPTNNPTSEDKAVKAPASSTAQMTRVAKRSRYNESIIGTLLHEGIDVVDFADPTHRVLASAKSEVAAVPRDRSHLDAKVECFELGGAGFGVCVTTKEQALVSETSALTTSDHGSIFDQTADMDLEMSSGSNRFRGMTIKNISASEREKLESLGDASAIAGAALADEKIGLRHKAAGNVETAHGEEAVAEAPPPVASKGQPVSEDTEGADEEESAKSMSRNITPPPIIYFGGSEPSTADPTSIFKSDIAGSKTTSEQRMGDDRGDGMSASTAFDVWLRPEASSAPPNGQRVGQRFPTKCTSPTSKVFTAGGPTTYPTKKTSVSPPRKKLASPRRKGAPITWVSTTLDVSAYNNGIKSSSPPSVDSESKSPARESDLEDAAHTNGNGQISSSEPSPTESVFTPTASPTSSTSTRPPSPDDMTAVAKAMIYTAPEKPRHERREEQRERKKIIKALEKKAKKGDKAAIEALKKEAAKQAAVKKA